MESATQLSAARSKAGSSVVSLVVWNLAITKMEKTLLINAHSTKLLFRTSNFSKLHAKQSEQDDAPGANEPLALGGQLCSQPRAAGSASSSAARDAGCAASAALVVYPKLALCSQLHSWNRNDPKISARDP